MNKLDESSTFSSFRVTDQLESFSQQEHQESTLRSEVEKALRRYFQHVEDEPVTDLHRMVMSEVEAPLLEAVMRYTRKNQSRASIMLGLNRGTLRTKLKLYGLL
ncbi:MAG: DNA-binding transcriptional regulator Fis [Gammaproteobacteria bacterium]|jgi:Fis family transcriptional regulator|nr:DNA-binding transcriptional regulator Fis [Gammaproteobacteria bacterium]MCH2344197.1 DNA-binding transcriptional regulator Fis [Pseudomonadales bacterium]MEC9223055.1 DNA-binding transcriptional regulator Fis [Pseudomonadota bacterium]MAU04494.1 DNA-binding transcriptional regulator Fis [Gammaproteobacteria bacterium]MCS5579203.1 DNA-binding transcriptional regulator Fis [Gammaproteobacteria bacterium]|tara:strand:- start:861 stop:1172 length:312 start_codon:yes stop_codon:yes gene_type:complete